MNNSNINNDIESTTTLAEEQVRMLFSSIPLSLAITFILAFILSASEWNIIGHGELLLWNTLMAGVISIRALGWYIWRTLQTSLSALTWLNIFRVGTMLSGAMWGASAFLMFSTYDANYQALLAFILAGVASGSTTTLAIDKYSVLGFAGLTIMPLTARFFSEHGPTAIPMGAMSVIYMFFIVSAATRARQNLEEQLYKNTRLAEWGNVQLKQQKIDVAIGEAQTAFINNAEIATIYKKLLDDIIDVGESTIGFLGDIIYNDKNEPSLKMHTFNKGLYSDNKEFMQKHAPSNMVFTNMDTLFGAAITKGKPIISNDVHTDMRAKGNIPDGHPTLNNFLGIPIYLNNKAIALLGIANKETGYNEADIELLRPFIKCFSQFFEAIQHEKQHALDAEKLKNNVQHTQAILDEIFDGIITIDKFGTIRSFNHAAETIFGYHSAEIIGQKINKLMPEPHRTMHDKYLHDYNKTHKASIIGIGRELTGLRRNGKEFSMDLAISETLQDGEPLYIGVVRDISEKKHIEQLKNQFISTVSHELRTPLTSIAGSLSIINSGSMGELPEKIKKMIMIAFHNSLRLQTLINDLLDMDKMASNKLVLNIETHSLDPLIKSAIDMNQAYADRFHVKLKLMSYNTNLSIKADSNRTQQILANLLSNAAKFSHQHGTVEIHIYTRDNFARVSITDHGDGIPNEFKAKIFERFTQADNTDGRKKGGSGLGLAISKELVERMGGSIGFTSNPGQGSCFYFELPLTQN